MELRDLRSFSEVARSGSFTVAARSLGYTQSAVSQHVSALEATVGQVLLERRPVRLTPAGERLLEHATHILMRLDVARSELAGFGADLAEVRIATSPFALTARVAAALRSLRDQRPSMTMSLITMAPAEAASAVARGDANLALVDGIVGPRNPLAYADAGLLASFTVGELPVCVGVPVDHPLAGRSAIDLETLVDARWIEAPALTVLPPGRIGAVHGGGPAPRFSYHGTDLATLVMLVAAGHGLALLPAQVAGPGTGVRLVRVCAPALVHRLELLVLRSASDRHRELIEVLREPGAGPMSPTP